MDINASLLGQAITFAILVLFTMKFVWPPLHKMLEERANRIASGLAAAERGRQELLSAEQRVTEELKHVQVRATEIMANAEKRGEQVVAAAKEAASTEAKRILADAQAEITQEVARAKEQLRTAVATLAIKGAEQILHAEIDKSRHETILTELMAKL